MSFGSKGSSQQQTKPPEVVKSTPVAGASGATTDLARRRDRARENTLRNAGILGGFDDNNPNSNDTQRRRILG